MLDLSKSSALLSNGQPVTNIMVGLGWDVSGGGQKGIMGAINRRKGVDLDLSAVALAGQRPLGVCWFDNARPFQGALHHTGDNRTGKGGGYDETILADLHALPGQVTKVVFVLNSYKGADFGRVNNATCGLFDTSNNQQQEIGQVFLPIVGGYTAALVLKVERDAATGGWTAQELEQWGHGNTWQDLQQFALRA
jgi:tellurium resistance protein TerZ